MKAAEITVQHPAARARPTTIIDAPLLSKRLGLDLFIASETFQLQKRTLRLFLSTIGKLTLLQRDGQA